jgi:hypothetical protein
MDVMEVALDKTGSAVERRLAIVDKNRDLYLTQVRVYGAARKTVKLGLLFEFFVSNGRHITLVYDVYQQQDHLLSLLRCSTASKGVVNPSRSSLVTRFGGSGLLWFCFAYYMSRFFLSELFSCCTELQLCTDKPYSSGKTSCLQEDLVLFYVTSMLLLNYQRVDETNSSDVESVVYTLRIGSN